MFSTFKISMAHDLLNYEAELTSWLGAVSILKCIYY